MREGGGEPGVPGFDTALFVELKMNKRGKSHCAHMFQYIDKSIVPPLTLPQVLDPSTYYYLYLLLSNIKETGD